MKSRNRGLWICTVLLTTCTAAWGQTPLKEGTSAMAAGDGNTAGASVVLPPAENLGIAWKSPEGATNFLAGSPSESNSRFNLLDTLQRGRSREQLPALGRGSFNSSISDAPAAAPGTGKAVLNAPGAKRSTSRVVFWSVQAIMFASTVASVEATTRCLNSGSCTRIPTPLQSRAALYGIGIPGTAAISVLSYEMRKHENRWWFLPNAITTAATAALTAHGVRAAH